jgi:hypothetical protein
MLHVNFNAYNNYVTDSLYQWDINQKLNIIGLNINVAPEIHFSNANVDRAIVKQSNIINGNIVVDIPNSLLQEALRIKAYIGIYEDTTFKVIETVEIPVIARTRPYDYQFEDTDGEVYSYKAIEAKVSKFIEDNTGIVATLYDLNNNGIVDDSERLGGKPASDYLLKNGSASTGKGNVSVVRNMTFYSKDGIAITDNINVIKCYDK